MIKYEKIRNQFDALFGKFTDYKFEKPITLDEFQKMFNIEIKNKLEFF